MRNLASRLLYSVVNIRKTPIRTCICSNNAGGRANISDTEKTQNVFAAEEMQNFRESLDAETQKRLDELIAEHEILKYADSRMPAELTTKNWKRLLRMSTSTERIKYLTFIAATQFKEERDIEKRRENKEGLEERLKPIREEIARLREINAYYGVSGNSIFQRILDSEVTRRRNSKLATAMMHGPSLIFDMGFFPHLRPIEASLTSKQLRDMYASNRSHSTPHNLILAGCNRNHESWRDLETYFGCDMEKLLITITEKHYTEIFPKEQLVYLTPDAKFPVIDYDPDKVYIIGACVDVVPRARLTLGKAKEEGIETRRLPMERCVRLIGKKELCLNNVVDIVNDAYSKGNFVSAIVRNIAQRRTIQKTSDVPAKRREANLRRNEYLTSLTV